MVRQRKPSSQALALFQAMLARPGEWRHGYDLTRELGTRSGTLYPLLIRLTEEGVMEAEWQAPARAGLPPRHAYRLTDTGVAFARRSLAQANSSTATAGLSRA